MYWVETSKIIAFLGTETVLGTTRVQCQVFRRVSKITKSDYQLRHISVCSFVRMEEFGSHLTDFRDISYFSIFRKSAQESQFNYNLQRIMGTLYEDLRTFMIVSRLILVGMRNVSDKSSRGNQSAHFMFNNFFLSEVVPFMT